MPFPFVERVIYKKPPLVEVICQFRFPPILSIETELPAKLQDAIRKEFPLFRENAEILFRIPELPKEIDPQVADKLEFPSSMLNRKNYEFRSNDEKWKLNLTRDFFALSTIQYHRWEEFRTWLDRAFNEFVRIYSPTYFTRVGLRYKDVIDRSVLGLNNVHWSELLQPYVIGILNAPEIGSNVVTTTHITEIKLEDNLSVVRITNSLVQNEGTKEIAFMIDSDFFTNQRTEIGDSLKKLDYFNQRGSRLIRWCITEKLHAAMEPENL